MYYIRKMCLEITLFRWKCDPNYALLTFLFGKRLLFGLIWCMLLTYGNFASCVNCKHCTNAYSNCAQRSKRIHLNFHEWCVRIISSSVEKNGIESDNSKVLHMHIRSNVYIKLIFCRHCTLSSIGTNYLSVFFLLVRLFFVERSILVLWLTESFFLFVSLAFFTHKYTKIALIISCCAFVCELVTHAVSRT